MSGIIVTKYSPVAVRPSETERRTPPPVAGDTIALSSFDRGSLPLPVTALLVFDRRIDKPAETIKGALSRALAYYRPIAGRLDGDGSGIVCTDEGVTFVAASASCALDDATMAVLPQMDLALRYPGVLCGGAEPLLLVQVTEFSCGGFIVGVTWNHILADAAGMAQFLQAVGELARGVSPPPSVMPIRSWENSDSVPTIPSSILAKLKSMIENEHHQHLARLDIVVPYGLINRIKAGEFGGEPCTVFEAVVAVLWRCRTRAALTPGDVESPAPLRFACNMRAHVGAPVGYYGNCVAMPLVPATVGVVANSDIGEIVALIRRAKKKVLLDLLPACSGDGDGGGLVASDQGRSPLWYEALAVTSWRNLGLDAIDLGGGAPARVLGHNQRVTLPVFVVCPPRRRRAGRDDDEVGVDVVAMSVKPEHVDAFLAELARLAASHDMNSPSTISAE